MKIRLRISLVVAIIAVVGLLYLQYVWIQKLYLIEQNRIRITALSVLDVVMADELVTSSLEWQKRYFDRGKTLPHSTISYDIEGLEIVVIREGFPKIRKKYDSRDEFFRFQRWNLARYHLPFSIGFCLCKTFGKVRYQTAVCYRKDRLCDAEAYRGDCQSGGQQELRARDRFAAVGDRRQGRAGRPFRQFVFGDVPPYAAFSGVVHRDRRNSHSDPVLLDLYDILSETGVRTTQEHVARDEESDRVLTAGAGFTARCPAAEQAREGRRIQNHAGQSNAR